MTMTATRPRTPASPPAAPPPRKAPAREPDPTLTATLVLALLTLSTAVGMGRLFDSWDFLDPFVIAALIGHGSAWACRRAGLSLPTALPLSLLGLLLVTAWVLFPQATTYGIPWVGTWEAASAAATEAWHSFATVVAPAPTDPGFLLAGMIGIGVAALLADWAAFRVRAVFEAGIPSFTLFLFTAVLGAPQYRAWSVAAYLAALLLFVLVHQAGMATESASWFASRSKGGVGALLQGGAVLGGLAILAAVLIGPNLPGSESEPVIAWRNTERSGPSKRTTVSPLVDIRGRLVEQSNVELFSVQSTAPAYWRLTSLDIFDGNIWQSNDTYKQVKSNLPDGVPVRAPRDSIVQDFTITALSSIWMPAAYRAERVESESKISFNTDTGSLISGSDTTDGYSYRVQSAMPRPTATALQQAAATAPRPDLEKYLALPSIPARVARQAADLTRGAATPYDKAKALQDWFQKNFRYDIGARQGHDGRALERFLFTNKRGYCEQFAGAFAVMARSIGLPARVAVGFTPGELGADGRYHVRGLNAHAWPEVYIEGFGWTYFEPTPGRGMPGSQDWTGIPAQQAPPGDPNSATTIPPTTAPPAPDDNTPTTADRPEEADDTVGTEDRAPKPSMLDNPLVRTGLVALALAVAWIVGIPAVKRGRRGRRRAAATDTAGRVLVAWAEAQEALAIAGVARRRSETIEEFSARAPGAASLGTGPAEALRQLGHDATAATYAGEAPATESASRSMAAAATIEQAIRESVSLRQRVLRELDPRPLLPEGNWRQQWRPRRGRAPEPA